MSTCRRFAGAGHSGYVMGVAWLTREGTDSRLSPATIAAGMPGYHRLIPITSHTGTACRLYMHMPAGTAQYLLRYSRSSRIQHCYQPHDEARLPARDYFSTLKNFALIATIIVLPAITAAPTAGSSSIPTP